MEKVQTKASKHFPSWTQSRKCSLVHITRTYLSSFTQFFKTISVSVPFIAISQKITSILYRPNLRVCATIVTWNTCTAKMLWILKEEDSKVPWEKNPCSTGAARQPSSSKYCNQACFDINSHNPHEKDPDKNKFTWEYVFLHSYSCIPRSLISSQPRERRIQWAPACSKAAQGPSPGTGKHLQHSFQMNVTQLISRSFGRKFLWY